MITKNRGNPQFEPLNSFQPSQKLDIKTSAADNQQTLTRIRIRIPNTYRSQPVISRLVSHYGLTVNITAAVLRTNGGDDGCFDLELLGTTAQIRSALSYLDKLSPDVHLELHESTPHKDGTHSYFNPFNRVLVRNGASKVDSPTQTRIKIQIPRIYQQQPVISHLTSDYGLTVNITGALLGGSSQEEGLFDLELHGTPQQIQGALAFLEQLNVKIWGKPNPGPDSW